MCIKPSIIIIVFVHVANGKSVTGLNKTISITSASPLTLCLRRSTAFVGCISAALTVIGHTVILRAIWRRHIQFSLETNEIYIIIAGLSVSDLLSAIGPPTLMLPATFTYRSEPICKIFRSMFSYLGFSTHIMSILIICLLSTDRYIAFAHCFRYHNIVNQKNILHALLIIWSGSITITGIAMADTNILPNSSFVEVRESFSAMFPTIVFVASLILVAIHGRLYIVTKRLFDSEENRHRRLFGKDAELNDLRRRRLKTTALSFAITVSYLGTLIPISVILILLRQSDKYVAIGTIVGPLSGFNPVLDPIIYGLTNKNLRKDVIKQAKEFWSGIRNSKIWQRNNRVYAFP